MYMDRKGEMEVTKNNYFSKAKAKGKSLVLKHVSILNWLPCYTKFNAICDFVAGFTVGLTLMPQSIAYASLAGLSPQYGLYTAFMGSLVYTVFGTIKEVSIGPTSLMALLTFQFTHDLPIEFIILLSFLAGCVELLMGILNAGFLVDFISAPVTSAFTSATSTIIIVSQLKGILGISFKSYSFIDNIHQLILHCPETHLWDAILGISCCVFLLLLRKLTAIPVGPEDPLLQTQRHKVIKKTLWFISIARNALVVLISSILAYELKEHGKTPFTLSGQIKSGLPVFQSPPFSAQIGNVTYSFPDMCKELGLGIILIPIVAILANVAIAKAFTSGVSLNATQEMITLGLCNIFGSFVQAFPTCGAFTRSAVSNASGVRTPMMGLYSGTMILLALGFLTPYFYYIPKATISAVLICAVFFMIEWEKFILLWRVNKRDFIVLNVTFLSCICMGVEVGLLVGVVCDIIYLLFMWARPNVDVEMCKSPVGGEYIIVTPDIGLPYAAVDFLQTEVCRIGQSEALGTLPVAVNCKNVKGFDFTSTMGIDAMIKHFEKLGQPLIFLNLKPQDLEMLHNAGVKLIQYCNSEEELVDMLFGEKLDLRHSETFPIMAAMSRKKNSVPNGDQALRRESDGSYVPRREETILVSPLCDKLM